MQLDAWMDDHYRRMDSVGQTRLDACNLIVTFNSGLAAGFVATAFQVNQAGGSGLIRSATALLGMAVLFAILVLFPLNRQVEVDAADIVRGASEGTSDADLLLELREASGLAARKNRESALVVVGVSTAQSVLALGAAILAGWSLLDGLN